MLSCHCTTNTTVKGKVSIFKSLLWALRTQWQSTRSILIKMSLSPVLCCLWAGEACLSDGNACPQILISFLLEIFAEKEAVANTVQNAIAASCLFLARTWTRFPLRIKPVCVALERSQAVRDHAEGCLVFVRVWPVRATLWLGRTLEENSEGANKKGVDWLHSPHLASNFMTRTVNCHPPDNCQQHCVLLCDSTIAGCFLDINLGFLLVWLTYMKWIVLLSSQKIAFLKKNNKKK